MMLLELFRSFYYRNYPSDMENTIELFSIFGGLDIDLDTSKTIDALIKEHILEHFEQLEFFVQNDLLHYDKNASKLLAAFAVNDRRIFTSFKRAKLNNLNGGVALEFLQESGLVRIEYSREEDKRKTKPKLSKSESRHRISDKFLIAYPFLRFWFYFIHPHREKLRQKEFKEFFEDFRKKKYTYTSLIFEELSRVLLNFYLRDEAIETIGSYWDANIEMDVLVVTQSKQIYVAECKWTNHKINKKELNKLIEKCEELGISPKKLVLFSKRGFSKELESMEGDALALFRVEDFKQLLRKKPTEFYFPLRV